jgi:four helix bundle protein
LADKSYAFAVRIVRLFKHLAEKEKEFTLSKQVLRSGTSIGAMVREAAYAQSKRDFINKLSIAVKEANETNYWLSLLKDTGYINQEMHNSISIDCEELQKLLASSIITLKKSLKKNIE